MPLRYLLAFLLATLLPHLGFAVISLDGSAGWNPITYDGTTPLGSPIQSDYIGDQGTGQGSSDIVGSANGADPFYAGFSKAYDSMGTSSILDDQIAFRYRLAEQGTTTFGGQPGYAKWAILGIDVGGDGALDLFVAANSQNIRYYTTGDDLNISPNTTSVDELAAFRQSVGGQDTLGSSIFTYLAVDGTTDSASPLDDDLDNGGDTDFFLSFKLDMSIVIAAYEASYAISNPDAGPAPTLDLTTSLSFLAATSTQPNAYNQDLNGYDNQGGAVSGNDTTTWVELGASSQPFTVDGETAIPEPAKFAMLSGLLALFSVAGRRRP